MASAERPTPPTPARWSGFGCQYREDRCTEVVGPAGRSLHHTEAALDEHVVGRVSRYAGMVDHELEFPKSNEASVIVPTKAVQELQRLLGDEGDVHA